MLVHMCEYTYVCVSLYILSVCVSVSLYVLAVRTFLENDHRPGLGQMDFLHSVEYKNGISSHCLASHRAS